jgi:hypothetical protein
MIMCRPGGPGGGPGSAREVAPVPSLSLLTGSTRSLNSPTHTAESLPLAVPVSGSRVYGVFKFKPDSELFSTQAGRALHSTTMAALPVAVYVICSYMVHRRRSES